MGTLVGCWLVGCSLKQKPAGRQQAADFPPPRAARVQIQKIRSSVKRRQAQRLATDLGKKNKERSCRWIADVLTSSGEVHGVLGIIVDLNRLG